MFLLTLVLIRTTIIYIMTDSKETEISLAKIDSQRQASDKRTCDGQSGSLLYQLQYHDDDSTVVRGKSTEVNRVVDSDRMGLEAIQEIKYIYIMLFLDLRIGRP